MIVLVLNAGSSSLKFRVADAEGTALASGVVERIGMANPQMTVIGRAGAATTTAVCAGSHGAALELLFDRLVEGSDRVLGDLSEIGAVGHRVLHSGHAFTDSTLITEAVLRELEAHDDLAPLHNPYNVLCVREALRRLPHVAHVAVFDSTFFANLPARAAYYALPIEYAEDLKVRRHGIHGTSYRYVVGAAGRFLGRSVGDLRMVVCHLGSGSSIAAVDRGTAIDTSAGLTPLEGLMMGTRCGDIDAGAVLFLMRRRGLGVDQVDALLNRSSGLLGVSGASSDMRDVLERAQRGDPRCRLAADMYAYRIKKYIGAYTAAMGGLDVLVFTGGIGEHSAAVREMVCADMGWLGVRLAAGEGAPTAIARRISSEHSAVDVLVVPTDEEGIIVDDTLRVIGQVPSGVAAAAH